MPIVYGSSSNLLSIRKKKLIYCLESTASICIVLQHCFAYKKEFFGTPEALSLPRLLTLFHPPLSNGGFQEVTFLFLEASLLFWVVFPCRLFSFPPAQPCGEPAAAALLKNPDTKHGCPLIAAGSHGKSWPLAAFWILERMAKKVSAAHSSHKL